ncbi:XRE family transcriptional regulator [Devosia sp. LjRoot16]|jgi:hypothetical protein
MAAPDYPVQKGVAGFSLSVPDGAFNATASKQMKVVLQGYLDAIAKSKADGRRVRLIVDVDPAGETVLTPVASVEATDETDPDLDEALIAARERGRVRAAEILNGKDMLSADEFGKLLGTTRVTVNSKRQAGQIVGLDGATRGFRYPIWQIGPEGKPYAELALLHERLGGAWAVFRFLVQPQAELDGMTGRQALESGKGKDAVEAAESVGRDFR